MSEMGTCRATIQVQSPAHTATGERVDRAIGYAIVHAAGSKCIDDVVFAKPGDMVLLGARSLEGLNLKIDARAKRLIPGGPILASASACGLYSAE